ncbi:unnamed protein product [Parascedosporium putredinis]|uniref:Vacuolar protein sorting-associated protein 16 homolog n=1 Tax=Parascedosporium putredinis TaxID=1442378 RepID=A0A9P1HAT0_9PEZI|nr:unnamed protein product [Parascedosporium putredinis]CAI8003006.1 unnamed protein product [Parascedosporium putredinis]
MDTAHPRASWERLGDKWYRRIEHYTEVFDLGLDLDNYIIAGAPMAVLLVSLWNDDSKLQQYQAAKAAKPSIDVHNYAGKKLRSIPWTEGTIKGLGWSEEEQLLVVLADGTVRCYDLQGDFTQFSLGHGADNYGVHSCRFYDRGMVAMLNNNTLVTVQSYNEPRPNIGQTVYLVDSNECEDRLIDIGPFSHITASPMVGSSLSIPNAVIAWEDEVHIIGQGDASAVFIYDTNRVHVISEHDGARIITNGFCEFIQQVPRDTFQVFGLFSESSPASILLDAIAQLEAHSPKADDYIQLIRGNLTEAVDTCINAAGREFNVHWEKQLLKAASFGKSVLDLYNSDDFVDMCETLRVLNAVRYFEIGMPLSYEQYQRLTPENLIKRLINRHEYLLALRVAGHLRLPTDRIYVHWASTKVRVGSEDDDTICRLVVEKLAGRAGVSFEEIAQAAYDEGRGRLATELLNHEPRAGRQVPLLLSMEEDELALDKAIESGDSDLILNVLLQLKKKLPLASFSGEGDNSVLKDLYYQDDRRVEGADVFIRESLVQPDARTASDKLALAAKLLSDSRETNFELRALKEATMLLRAQESFDRDLTDTFTGLSVNETMFKLIKLGYIGKAKKIQSEFKVPDRVAWWIRLRALVAKRDWDEIAEVAKAKKSPIGWEPFFNLTLQAGNPRLAATFVPKCTNVEHGETITMYEKCGMKVKAAEEAVRLKNKEAFTKILEAAGRNTHEGREIERLGATVFKP